MRYNMTPGPWEVRKLRSSIATHVTIARRGRRFYPGGLDYPVFGDNTGHRCKRETCFIATL